MVPRSNYFESLLKTRRERNDLKLPSISVCDTQCVIRDGYLNHPVLLLFSLYLSHPVLLLSLYLKKAQLMLDEGGGRQATPGVSPWPWAV